MERESLTAGETEESQRPSLSKGFIEFLGDSDFPSSSSRANAVDGTSKSIPSDTVVSRWGSCALSTLTLASITSGWLIATVIAVYTGACVERLLLATEDPELILAGLSFICPITSILSMASPLTAVTCAIFSKIGTDSNLQWRLYMAFGFSSTLGVAYGYRKGLKSIVISSVCGLLLQILSLTACYHLAEWPRRVSSFLIRPGRDVEGSVVLRGLVKWTIYLVLVSVVLIVLGRTAILVPLESVLSPIFTLSCVLPYAATFSTLSRDVKSYRRSKSVNRDDSQFHKENNPVDLQTLGIMQFANTVWLSFGILLGDMVVISSSAVAFVFGAVQVACYFCPTISCRISLDGAKASISKRTVFIDPALIFVGEKFVLENDCSATICLRVVLARQPVAPTRHKPYTLNSLELKALHEDSS